MARPIFLHPYAPSVRPDDQVLTWDWLRAMGPEMPGPVLHWATTTSDGYWRALESVWDWNGPLVVLEHDIVPCWSYLTSLLGCPEEYCAYDYRLANGQPWSELKGGHGFGFAKLGPGRRGNIVPRPQVPHLPFPDVVAELHHRLGAVHIHYPRIEHHHGLA